MDKENSLIIMFYKIFRFFAFYFFSLFYEKKYLKGYYFTKKRMGWYWAFIDLKSKIIGANRSIPWPVNPQTIVSNNNVVFDVDDINIFQVPGCYWQCRDAKIYIGKGTMVAPNVGIITTNHDIYDVRRHVEGKEVILGEKCWIGMNAVILPGVELGPGTVVGAGAVVTHSFKEGFCVLGGVPARMIKKL